MEGYPAWEPTPTGYFNTTTPYFYPRPEITGNVLTLNQVYVSPQGSDDVNNNGVITSPFATISAALFYVTTILDQPLVTPVCIFVAPGTYEGGFAVPDNVFLIGPSSSPQPVVITGTVFAVPSATSGTIGLQNITFQGVIVAGAFFDANVEMRNCTIETNTVFSALSIAPESGAINASVIATECIFNATETTNIALISANTSELTSLELDNCRLTTAGEGGSLINITGNLLVRNSTLSNTAAGTTLAPLIISQSGATLTPLVSLEGSVLKYDDLQTDTSGNKLAIRFNAPTQPITARMTNCTISVQLGGGNTDIVKNIGAEDVTLTQSANSCLLDGKDIDTTNINLPAAAFLQDSPSGGGGGGDVYQATYYKTTAQNMTSGNTDVTFDGEATWNNDNGYITHTGGTAAFTVVQAGLYQLEFNATILINGATWVTTANKTINIDVTRSPTAEQTIVSSTGLQGLQSYSQCISSTFNLDAGDVINLRLGNVFTGGPAQIQQLQNTFDFNTFFTWRYISTGGNAGVTSVAGLTGAVALSSPDSSITIIASGSDIELTSNSVTSLEGLSGNVALTSPDSSIVINTNGNDIELTAVAPVSSVGAKTGAVTFGVGSGIALDYGASNADPITLILTSPVIIQAAGTTALTTANRNTIFILTSGTTQNFTTAGLGAGDVGKVWYVKNAFSADIDIEAGGVAIAGQTDTIHAGSGSANSSMQIIYWDGTVLTMY